MRLAAPSRPALTRLRTSPCSAVLLAPLAHGPSEANLHQRRTSGAHASSSQAPVPSHVACIMDGNFRWGRHRGGDWRRGHEAGVDALRRVVKWCKEDGVRGLTVFAFSTENWARSRDEVSFLMRLLESSLLGELSLLKNEGVRLTFAGDRGALPESLRSTIERAEEATAANDALVLCVCLSYGGRQDITHAAQQLCRQVQEGTLTPEQVTEALLARHLTTHAARAAIGSDPDLLIRTSGEMRLSNFLLWEGAYTEMYFSPLFWPDFDHAEWKRALQHYGARQRRYGRRRGGESSVRHAVSGML